MHYTNIQRKQCRNTRMQYTQVNIVLQEHKQETASALYERIKNAKASQLCKKCTIGLYECITQGQYCIKRSQQNECIDE